MNGAKAIALGTAALALIGLSACSTDTSDEGATGHNYVTAYGCEPKRGLVPADTNEICGTRVVRSIFAGLVSVDEKGDPHNDLAEDISLEGDRTYHVTLKDGLKFSDGSPLTSHNFVDAWNFAVANDLVSAKFLKPIKGYADSVEKLEGLSVQDDRHFTIELGQPQSDFLLALSYHAYFPMPDSALEDIKAYGENPIGAGPYKLTDWQHESTLTIVPNENYTGEFKPRNDGIKFVMYPKLEAAYADLQADNLDVLDQIPTNVYDTFKQDLDGRGESQPAGVAQYLGINYNSPHFGDTEEGRLRRKAISMAFDRKEISDKILGGVREPATEFTAAVNSGYSADIPGHEFLEFNPERARELWAQADAISPYEGQLKLSFNADADHRPWMEAIANQLRNELKVDAVLNPYPDFKSMISDVAGGSIEGIYRTGWFGDYPSQNNFLTPMFSTGGAGNDELYNSERFDAALADANSKPTVEEANKGYLKSQEILFDDMPLIPTWYGAVAGGYSTKVHDVVFSWNSFPLYYKIAKD